MRIDESLRLADALRCQFQTDAKSDRYRVIESNSILDNYTIVDPLKIVLDITTATKSPDYLRRHLLEKYGIYVKQISEKSILIDIVE